MSVVRHAQSRSHQDCHSPIKVTFPCPILLMGLYQAFQGNTITLAHPDECRTSCPIWEPSEELSFDDQGAVPVSHSYDSVISALQGDAITLARPDKRSTSCSIWWASEVSCADQGDIPVSYDRLLLPAFQDNTITLAHPDEPCNMQKYGKLREGRAPRTRT